MKKIVVRGFKKDKFSSEEIQSAKDSKLELKNSYQFSTSRAAADKHELSFDDTDLLEFVFDDIVENRDRVKGFFLALVG